MAVLCRFAQSGGPTLNVKVDVAALEDAGALLRMVKREFHAKGMPLPDASAITLHDGKDTDAAVIDPDTPLSALAIKRGKWFCLHFEPEAGATSAGSSEAGAGAPAQAQPPPDAPAVSVAPVDIGIRPAHHAAPMLLPHGLCLPSYTAALPPRTLAGTGFHAHGTGEAQALQEEDSTALMRLPELPVSLHFLACGASTPPAHPTAPLTLGAVHAAATALHSAQVVAVAALPAHGSGTVPVDSRLGSAWSATGATTLGITSASVGDTFHSQPGVGHLVATLTQGCKKVVSLLPPPPGEGAAADDWAADTLRCRLHSLGVTTYHPWALRVVVRPPPDTTSPLHVAAVDVPLTFTDAQLDGAVVGDLLAAVAIALLARSAPLRLELRQPRAALPVAHALLTPSSDAPANSPAAAGLALPVGGIVALNGPQARATKAARGGDVPLPGGAAGVLGCGLWGPAFSAAWGKAWGPGALPGLPLPVPAPAQPEQGQPEQALATVAGCSVAPPTLPLRDLAQVWLREGVLGLFTKNTRETRGTTPATSGPGASLRLLHGSAVSALVAGMTPPLVPAAPPLDTPTTWCALPWAITAVMPLSPHTYCGRSPAWPPVPADTPSLQALAGDLPAGYAAPAPLPPPTPSVGPPPTDLGAVQADLAARHAMLVVVHGKNLPATVDGRPGITLELHEDATVGHLLQALGEGGDPAAGALGGDAPPGVSGRPPAWALWLDRGYWATHVPGDVLDEEEGRRRRPGYFGLDRSSCGGGGGVMEATAHFGMRLRDLGVGRLNAVFVVADLRWGRPDTARGLRSKKAAKPGAAE